MHQTSKRDYTGWIAGGLCALGLIFLAAAIGYAANDVGCFPVSSGSCVQLTLEKRTTAVTCVSGRDNGRLFYDTGTKKLCVCNAGAYECSAALATTTTTTTTSTSTSSSTTTT